MQEKELWKYFLDKKIAQNRPFDRDFLWILKEDFEPIKKYFKKEFNILHPGDESFRSFGYLLHIHAVYQGNYIFIHQDFGNVARFFPLGIIHLFIDVIPFFVFVLIKGIKAKSLILIPSSKNINTCI